MTIKEALEKTIKVWTERWESDEYLNDDDYYCPICKQFDDCYDCPANSFSWDGSCGAFIDEYTDQFSLFNEPEILLDKETKDLVCEQAIGYADMLLREVKP
jgi:hypothetical protein